MRGRPNDWLHGCGDHGRNHGTDEGRNAGPLGARRILGLGMGGAETNFAIALKRLGTSVTWLGRVGQDSLGDLVLREVAAEGITTLGIRDVKAPTGLMIKERRTPEHLKVWYYRSASAGSRLAPEDVPVGAIRNAKLLHLTGITPALSESAADAAQLAVTVAREAGVTVSFDLNYRAALWSPDQAGPAFRKFIEQADLVFAGDDEAAMAVGALRRLDAARTQDRRARPGAGGHQKRTPRLRRCHRRHRVPPGSSAYQRRRHRRRG